MARTIVELFLSASEAAIAQLVEVGGPNWFMAATNTPWRVAGGDWLDVNEAPNGSVPWAAFTVTSDAVPQTFVLNVTSLIRRLLQKNTGLYIAVQGPTRFATREAGEAGPKLAVVMADGGRIECPCVADGWISSSSNQFIGGDTAQTPMLVKFDLETVPDTFERAELALTKTASYVARPVPFDIVVNYLDMPVLLGTPPPPPPPPPPPVENRAPEWHNVNVVFEHGIARTVNLTGPEYVFDADGDQLAFAIETAFDPELLRQAFASAGVDPALAEAFAWDPSTFSLSYDGRDLGIREGSPEGDQANFEITVPSIGLTIIADDGKL